MAIVKHPTDPTDYAGIQAFYDQFRGLLTITPQTNAVQIRAPSDPQLVDALTNAISDLNGASPIVVAMAKALAGGGGGGSDPRVDGLVQDVVGLKAADAALHQDVLSLQAQDATQTANHQQVLARVQGLEGKAAAVKAAL